MKKSKGIFRKINRILDKPYLNGLHKKIANRNYNFTDKEKDVLKRLIRNASSEQKFFSALKSTFPTLYHNGFANILLALGDPSLIKICLDKTKEINFSPNDIVRLLSQVNDEEYTQNYIDNYTWLLQKTEEDKTIFISSLNKHTKGIFDFYIRQGFEPQQFETFDLPEGMTIGIEIEAIGKECYNIPTLFGWNSKFEHTITSPGAEIISPILTGTKQDAIDLYTTCNILKKIGMSTNHTCGGHVHIGANFLTQDQSLENLIALWGNTEDIIYAICNDKNDKLRGINYATPISSKISEVTKNRRYPTLTAAYINCFIGNRLTSMNLSNIDYLVSQAFKSVSNNPINTIEFRVANSTLNPEVWIQNVNLFGGMVNAAEKLTQISQKNPDERTEKESTMLKAFKKLCTTTCLPEEKLECLLDLAINSEENKDIYRKRFEANVPLIKSDISLYTPIDSGTTKKPLMPRKIADALFTGQNRITGSQIINAENRLHRDLENYLNRNNERI